MVAGRGILDYSGKKIRVREGDVIPETGQGDVGPGAKESRQRLGARKGEKTDFSLEPASRRSVLDFGPVTEFQILTSRTVR